MADRGEVDGGNERRGSKAAIRLGRIRTRSRTQEEGVQ